MNLTNIEACQTTNEMEMVIHELRYLMSKSASLYEMCKPRCTTTYLNIKEVEIMINKGCKSNVSELFFQWEDESMIVQEEYLLMDLNAIVSAVGGSLGLFLGFSWLQVLLKIIQKIQDTIP